LEIGYIRIQKLFVNIRYQLLDNAYLKID